jgi:uncharacterized membrane protein (UPF0127 family)
VKNTQKKRRQFKLWEKIAAGALVIGLISYIIISNFPAGNNKNMSGYKFKKEGELLILDSLNSAKVRIDIEFADTEYERQLGLMLRDRMDEKQGMLFVFPTEKYQSFWMRNTNISLDMIFINEQKEIVTIHKNTTPLSEQSYPSSSPAKFVLEVISGFTDKYNVQEGDKLNWIGI